MSPTIPASILEPFLAAADTAAASRPEVDRDMAREVMGEAAEILHNGLALDHLDEHDHRMVVESLATALVAADPTEAVRALADADADGAHDPDEVRAAYLVAIQVLGL